MKKKIILILIYVIGLIGIFLLGSWLYHSIKIAQEKEETPPIGEMVEVNGHDMHVYTDGNGEQTIVFLAGGGTSAPTLDFKPLWSLLTDSYNIVIVEKAGYGWSDVADVSRELDFMLEETRTALSKAGQQPPYILAPHSMSGLEAIRWAQIYPDEVEAIIGLDAAVPEVYDVLDIPPPVVQSLAAFAARVGLLRLIPSVVEGSAAIDSGNLSEADEKMYRALFHQQTVTKNMIEEAKQVVMNAKKVKDDQIPTSTPMHFFISTGGEIGLEDWPTISTDFLKQIDQSSYMLMGPHHYVHTYEPEKIALEIHGFLQEIEKSNDKSIDKQ